MQVLLVEDDASIAKPLVDGLAHYGFAVDWVGTGAAALDAPRGEMVLLDLGLPDMDGIDVCRRLRQDCDVPVIMLTARREEADRVVGLELGADDYLPKPFSLRELVARMRAVTRRTAAGGKPGAPGAPGVPGTARPGESVQVVGDLTIDRRTRRVELAGEPVTLAPKEFDLLALLAEDPGAVCSRQRILDTVWETHFFGPTKTLDVHISALRRKLGDPGRIETLRCVGFRLVVPSQDGPDAVADAD